MGWDGPIGRNRKISPRSSLIQYVSSSLLLGADVILLEGIRLENVKEGVYLLNAAPLNLSGSDGAPCRAILIENI